MPMLLTRAGPPCGGTGLFDLTFAASPVEFGGDQVTFTP